MTFERNLRTKRGDCGVGGESFDALNPAFLDITGEAKGLWGDLGENKGDLGEMSPPFAT
jgi:hypothetical protein